VRFIENESQSADCRLLSSCRGGLSVAFAFDSSMMDSCDARSVLDEAPKIRLQDRPKFSIPNVCRRCGS
jgi:hypothetical protein